MPKANPPLTHESFAALWYSHEHTSPWVTATETERQTYFDRASYLGEILHVGREIIADATIDHPLIGKLATLLHLVDTPVAFDPLRELTVEDFPGLKAMTERQMAAHTHHAKDGYFQRMKKDFI